MSHRHWDQPSEYQQRQKAYKDLCNLMKEFKVGDDFELSLPPPIEDPYKLKKLMREISKC